MCWEYRWIQDISTIGSQRGNVVPSLLNPILKFFPHWQSVSYISIPIVVDIIVLLFIKFNILFKLVCQMYKCLRREEGEARFEDKPGGWQAEHCHRLHTPCCCTGSPPHHTQDHGREDRHSCRSLSCSIFLSWSFSSDPSGSRSDRVSSDSQLTVWIYRIWRPSQNTGIHLSDYNCPQLSDISCVWCVLTLEVFQWRSSAKQERLLQIKFAFYGWDRTGY